MTAPIRPAPPKRKRKITPDDYRKYLQEGYTPEEIAEEADVVAPSIGGSILQGITAAGTWADEAEGVARGTGRWLAGKVRGTGESWRDAVADEQARAEKANTQLPLLSLASGLVSGGAAGKEVAKRVLVNPRGAQLLKQAAVGAGAGAGAGVVAGSGAGSPGNRLESGLVGGGLGTLFGLFLSGAVAPGARQARRYFGGDTRTTADEKSAAALQEVLERQGVANSDDATRAAASRLTRPGASGRRVMDTSREMQELSVDAARASRRVEKRLEQLAESRIANQNTALADDFADAVGVRRGGDAPRIADSIREGIEKYEDQAYARLFAKHPGGIPDPEVGRAWQEVSTYLQSVPRGMEANQVLADRSLLDIMDAEGPTLQGLHRLKTAIGDRAAKLNAKDVAQNLSDEEAGRLASYSAITDRLRSLIERAPGGDEWAAIQREGAKARAKIDALGAGEDLMGPNLKGYTAEKALSDASGGAAGPKGQEMLRRGAASKVRDESRQATRGSDALLNRLTQQDATQDVVDAIAPDPQRAATFRRNMQDRARMAETDAAHVGVSTKQKEILKGARANSNALAFGESGVLGSPVTGTAPTGSIGLAVGALGAKALQGRRGKATALAADDLAKLLVRGADDPAANLTFYDMAMALERLQRKRMAAQAGASAAGSSFLSTRTAR